MKCIVELKVNYFLKICFRLLKNALKVTSTTTPVGVTRRGVARRLSQLSRDLDRDENQPPNSVIISPNKFLKSPSKVNFI